jgi:hypothetical protein
MDGIVSPVDPSHARWKNAGPAVRVMQEMTRVKEEKVGDTEAERYENKSGPKFVLWFGKEDGILRKQVLYKKDDKGEYTIEWITSIVEKIDRKPKIDKTTFTNEFGDGEKAQDTTKQLEEQLKDEPKKK